MWNEEMKTTRVGFVLFPRPFNGRPTRRCIRHGQEGGTGRGRFFGFVAVSVAADVYGRTSWTSAGGVRSVVLENRIRADHSWVSK